MAQNETFREFFSLGFKSDQNMWQPTFKRKGEEDIVWGLGVRRQSLAVNRFNLTVSIVLEGTRVEILSPKT